MLDLPTHPRLVIFDLDGVVYRGADPVPGVADAITRIAGAGVLTRFATNNSTADRDAYVTRLGEMGIATTRDAITTSTSATIAYLQRHEPTVRRILGVGENGLFAELRAAGFDAIDGDAAAARGYDGGPLTERFDAVVVGLDRDLRYHDVAAASQAVRDGARFIATNADERYPTAAGFLPGAGSGVAAIAVAAGVEPAIIGKPSAAMFTAILEAAGVAPGAAIVVGDNPAADIVAANRAGIASLLVLSGIADAASAAQLDGERAPSAVMASAADLPALLAGG